MPAVTERFVKAKGYWCSRCGVPWEVRIVAPPGGCLHRECRRCGRDYYLAATTVRPNVRRRVQIGERTGTE